jgi:hypothetical protein
MLTDAEIAEIAQGLLDRSLPPPRWTHEAHFAAAVWLLRHGGDFDMAAIIRDYNAATGTPNTDSSGYHHSITFASLAAARAALKASPAAPLADVLAGLMAGPCGRTGRSPIGAAKPCSASAPGATGFPPTCCHWVGDKTVRLLLSHDKAHGQ